MARILSVLKIRKKLGKAQYIPKWKRGASVMLCRMQEQTDHICQDASVSWLSAQGKFPVSVRAVKDEAGFLVER